MRLHSSTRCDQNLQIVDCVQWLSHCFNQLTCGEGPADQPELGPQAPLQPCIAGERTESHYGNEQSSAAERGNVLLSRVRYYYYPSPGKRAGL